MTLDIFHNGTFDSSWSVRKIRHELIGFQLGGWIIRETLRTRYRHDSRFHVYLYHRDDHTQCATLIFHP